jgi:hypothetical protein
MEIDMNLALTAQGPAGVDLPAPFLVRQQPNTSIMGDTRRTAAGVGIATLLHAGMLAAVVHAITQGSPPVVIPPQPLMTVSLVTPEVEKPAPTSPSGAGENARKEAQACHPPPAACTPGSPEHAAGAYISGDRQQSGGGDRSAGTRDACCRTSTQSSP